MSALKRTEHAARAERPPAEVMPTPAGDADAGDRASLVRAIDPPRSAAGGAGRSARAYVEAVLLTAAVPLTGWLVDRSDPFWLRHP
ncbi:MAG: hypothetical protein JOZ69_22655, partial [Myxococcales bacterium]|nr:hypothetical protein [Myxococcales bacterium]